MPVLTQAQARDYVRRTLDDKGRTSSYIDASLSSEQIDDAINDALAQYSNDRPLDAVAEFVGDGGHYYPITHLTGYQEQSSFIKDIEYPAASQADDDEPQWLDLSLDLRIHSELVAGTRTLFLYFPNHSPRSTETVRVYYTRQVLIGNVPEFDKHAFLQLACAFGAERMVSKYADVSEPSIKADIINYSDRARRWRQLADYFHANYYRMIGRTESGDPIADSTFLDWDSDLAADSLFHGRRYI